MELYVNDYSIDMGDEGSRAVEELLRRAAYKTEGHGS
jgi:predicted solute-binding protein